MKEGSLAAKIFAVGWLVAVVLTFALVDPASAGTGQVEDGIRQFFDGQVSVSSASEDDVLTWNDATGTWGAEAAAGGLPTPSAQGSILLATAAPVYDELVIGAADTVLTSDGTTASWAAPASSTVWCVALSSLAFSAEGAVTTTPTWTTLGAAGTGMAAPIMAFDGSTSQSAIVFFTIPEAYATGSDLTLKYKWSAAGTTQAVEWEFYFGTTTGVDFDSATPTSILDAAILTGVVTASGTQGIYTTGTLTLANGLLDGMQPGDLVVLKLRRDATDTSAVTAYMHDVKASQ